MHRLSQEHRHARQPLRDLDTPEAIASLLECLLAGKSWLMEIGLRAPVSVGRGQISS